MTNLFIEKLAEADEHDLVKNISEVFLDYFVI